MTKDDLVKAMERVKKLRSKLRVGHVDRISSFLDEHTDNIDMERTLQFMDLLSEMADIRIEVALIQRLAIQKFIDDNENMEFDHVIALIAHNVNKIQAIMIYREYHPGLSVMESKLTVEGLMKKYNG